MHSKLETKLFFEDYHPEHERVSESVLGILNSTKMPDRVGIGLELEFFIRNSTSKKLCSLGESQAFLRELSHLKGWAVFSTNEANRKILRVSKNLKNNRYHSVKYEHPPHMMEIAFSYDTNLLDLKTTLIEVLSELEEAAKKSCTELEVSGKIEAPKIYWDEVNQISNQYESLSKSRNKIFENHKNTTPDERIDFTTFTAATQFHIGGIKWWKESPTFLDRIYRSEFLISGLPFNGSVTAFRERWNAYRYVFDEMILLGFPSFQGWSFDAWIDGLLKAPYLSGTARVFSEVVRELTSENLKKEIMGLRDLQIVKPKWIGTLEYRSDPATKNVDRIMQMAAMRLGAYISALKPHSVVTLNEVSFRELSALWWQGNHLAERKLELEQLKERCFDSLRSRGFGEEWIL